MNRNIYALYQGDCNLTDGTLMEIAKNHGMKIESVQFLLTPSYRKRVKSKNIKELVLIERR